MGRHGGAPSLKALIKETQTGQYAAALHVGDFAYDLASDGGEVSAKVYVELFCASHHDVTISLSSNTEHILVSYHLY